MTKKTLVVAAAALAVMVAGGLYASNMGFKLAYQLTTATNASQNALALPYNQQSGLDNASNLLQDIESSAGIQVTGVAFYNNADGFTSYSELAGADYALQSGTAYLVQVETAGTYIVVGSHKPGFVVNLTQASNASQNFFAYPYHSTSPTAADLLAEIGPDALNIAFYNTGDGFTSYPSNPTNFSLKPGEGYLIQVANPIAFIPAHY
jgi:hypothetical protein